MKDNQLIAIVVGSLILAAAIVFLVFKYAVKINKPIENAVTYSSKAIDTTALRKISLRPVLLGLENKFVNKEELYFDNGHLYVMNNTGKFVIFKLENITELRRTSTQINNRPVWQLKMVADDGKEIGYLFVHNYTIWNKNFYGFYKRLQEINPNSIKSEWSAWRL